MIHLKQIWKKVDERSVAAVFSFMTTHSGIQAGVTMLCVITHCIFGVLFCILYILFLSVTGFSVIWVISSSHFKRRRLDIKKFLFNDHMLIYSYITQYLQISLQSIIFE